MEPLPFWKKKHTHTNTQPIIIIFDSILFSFFFVFKNKSYFDFDKIPKFHLKVFGPF